MTANHKRIRIKLHLFGRRGLRANRSSGILLTILIDGSILGLNILDPKGITELLGKSVREYEKVQFLLSSFVVLFLCLVNFRKEKMAQPRLSNGRFAPNPNNPNPKKRKPKVKQLHTVIQPINLPRQKTFYTIVLDCSVSMRSLRQAAIEAFNARVDALKQSAAQYNQDAYVSLLTFGTTVYPNHFNNVPINEVKRLTTNDYNPNDGATALLDGVGAGLERCGATVIGANDAFLVEVITDGYENNSKVYSGHASYGRKSLVHLLQQCQGRGNYTIVFQVPKGQYKQALHHSYNIPLDNICEWETTVQGTQDATVATQTALSSYMQSRERGQKMSTAFYAPVDMSKVSSKDLHNKLTNICYKFKTFEVGKEQDIKEFVEEKTKRPFVIGSAYYQLTKSEKVQPSKDILIMEKPTPGVGKNVSPAIWGGQEARNLIGLKNGVDNQVDPFNLANYLIFIKSTSVNRKLVRGTKLLFDLTATSHASPTWGTVEPPLLANA